MLLRTRNKRIKQLNKSKLVINILLSKIKDLENKNLILEAIALSEALIIVALITAIIFYKNFN